MVDWNKVAKSDTFLTIVQIFLGLAILLLYPFILVLTTYHSFITQPTRKLNKSEKKIISYACYKSILLNQFIGNSFSPYYSSTLVDSVHINFGQSLWTDIVVGTSYDAFAFGNVIYYPTKKKSSMS
jgi:hypothetical protein